MHINKWIRQGSDQSIDWRFADRTKLIFASQAAASMKPFRIHLSSWDSAWLVHVITMYYVIWYNILYKGVPNPYVFIVRGWALQYCLCVHWALIVWPFILHLLGYNSHEKDCDKLLKSLCQDSAPHILIARLTHNSCDEVWDANFERVGAILRTRLLTR